MHLFFVRCSKVVSKLVIFPFIFHIFFYFIVKIYRRIRSDGFEDVFFRKIPPVALLNHHKNLDEKNIKKAAAAAKVPFSMMSK